MYVGSIIDYWIIFFFSITILALYNIMVLNPKMMYCYDCRSSHFSFIGSYHPYAGDGHLHQLYTSYEISLLILFTFYIFKLRFIFILPIIIIIVR